MIYKDRKLFLFIFSILFTICFSQKKRSDSIIKGSLESSKAANFISVNSGGFPEVSYSISDLVSKVLISGGSDCSEPSVTNVKVYPDRPSTNTSRSWGYFNSGTTAFPFSEGIILSTGYARNAGNNFISGTLSDNIGTGGDDDLATAINPQEPLTNATYIEFDFVPFNNELTFNFLFASEEYNNTYNGFPCSGYSDGFALMLKKQGSSQYTNLAILPNNAGPVSVTNIVPASYSCGPLNAGYFGGHNTANIETNFNGRVVPLKAYATVEPGKTYHFKMVLADAGDSMYDSAVFLEAGSFNLGVQFQDESGVNLGSKYVLCEGQSITVSASTSVTNPTFKWYKNGELIAGSTGNAYTITSPGIYRVEVYVDGSTCPIATNEIEIIQGHAPVAKDAILSECSDQNAVVFNLEEAKPEICSETGVEFRFYENENDANAGNSNFISNPTSYLSGNKTLYVRVDNGVCTKVVELQLLIMPLNAVPTIIASSTVLCQGGSIVLTSSEDYGNIWSTGETTKSITITEPGTYTLKYTNGNCESQTVSITITLQPDIHLQISGNLLLCDEGTTTLTSSSNTGNLWSTGETTPSITVSSAGVYSLSVTTEHGCVFSEMVTVTLITPIVFNNNAELKVCSASLQYSFNLYEAEADITTTSSVSFTYYENKSDAIAGNNNFIITPESYTSGTRKIYVRLTDGQCFKVAELQITVNPLQSAPEIITDTSVLCENGSIVLTSSEDYGNIWSTGETTKSITITEPGIYTLQYTTDNCSSETASITISRQADIQLTIISDLVICEGGTTTLTSSSNTGNNWSTGETTKTITVNEPGNYTLTVTTEHGCVFTKTVTVNKTIFNLTIAPAPKITCSTPQIQLNANGSEIKEGDVIVWTATAGGNIVSGENTLTPFVNAAGQYILTVKRGKCSGSKIITVEEDKTPISVSLSSDRITICEGESAVITASGGLSYIWHQFDNNFTATQSVSPLQTTTYTVSGYGNNGCLSLPSEITIEVVPSITSSLEGGLICEGDAIILDAGAGPNYTYLWSTGETQQSITVNHLDTYTVTISNGVCSQNFTAEVQQAQLPVITEVIYHDPKITINAINNGTVPLEYSINGGITWSDSNIFEPVQRNHKHHILVRNKNTSCIAEAEYFTFFLSNAVTPNGDKHNDMVDFSGIVNYENFNAKIFDRFGKEVFTADKNRTIWDGTLDSRKLPSATYWYVVMWDDPITGIKHQKTGWLLLKTR